MASQITIDHKALKLIFFINIQPTNYKIGIGNVGRKIDTFLKTEKH